MRDTTKWLLQAGLALALSAPIAASAQSARPTQATESGGPDIVQVAPAPAPCDATSITSPPGKAWWAAERWRYATDAAATAAYLLLVNNGKGGSPWATWYLPTPTTPATAGVFATPPLTILPVGTRFQMAMAPAPTQPNGPGQTNEMPGGWGTFDYIADVQDVREFLAVTHTFKATVDRVVTYEVTQMMPVLIGPVGPQVDAETCEYFPGRWSQFNMLPAWNQRMNYLKIVEVRPIH